MSGEGSKSSGEFGERLAAGFLTVIGWAPSMKNVTVSCALPEEHNKKTHGDDCLFVYNSPFDEETTEVIHVSVKHNKDGYAKSAQTFRNDLKAHLVELATIVTCAAFHDGVKKIVDAFQGKPRKRHKGLLLWLHSDTETLENDRRQDLGPMQVPDELSKYPAIFVDAARASFIYQALLHIEGEPIDSRDFYYPRLGSAPPADPARSGNILPVELIASDVLPIKAKKNDKPILYLYVRDSFTVQTLKKSLSLAIGFADAWVDEIHVGFPDFVESHHSQARDEALMAFSSTQAKMNVFSFKKNILSL